MLLFAALTVSWVINDEHTSKNEYKRVRACVRATWCVCVRVCECVCVRSLTSLITGLARGVHDSVARVARLEETTKPEALQEAVLADRGRRRLTPARVPCQHGGVNTQL